MVSPMLLEQVGELDRASQVELIDFLYREIDQDALDQQTVAILDERLAGLDAHPNSVRPLSEVLADLRAKWQR